MEYGSIEREIHVDASPEVVYEVVSTPEHLAGWWPDEAELEPGVGGAGTFRFGDSASPDRHVELVTVVEADPYRRFSFRWVYDEGVTAAVGNSLLVTFDLLPTHAGTLLRMTETGFRERGWEAAKLEALYRDHVSGWDYYLPRVAPYVTKLVSAP
ncbi:uncharacterized protein YndB with AHSA1/START domain [Streptacidiphilus sp. MAP12-33]|uniref:SRPBCC domain-containing protein n=1 Tax=Streptacidiphilus sp. MAP12-33 TaxID=3156266 RepID=UPI00351125E3